MSTETGGDPLWLLVEKIADELEKIIAARFKKRKNSNLAGEIKICLSGRLSPDFFVEVEGRQMVAQRVAGRIQVTIGEALMRADVLHEGVIVAPWPLEKELPEMFSIELQWYKFEKDGPPIIHSPRE